MTEHLELIVLIAKLAMAIGLITVVVFVFYQHWRGVKLRALRLMPEEKRIPVQHDVRLDGMDAYIMNADVPAGKIVLGGWRVDPRWADGDFLVIWRGKNGVNTRYRIDRLDRHVSSGFYIASCTFAPRGPLGAVRARP